MSEMVEWRDLAANIVNKLLSDLPKERQDAVREAIEDALVEWGFFTSSVTYESSCGER